MKRFLLLTFGLLAAPALVAAQVEIGIDGGLTVESFGDQNGLSIDSETDIDFPSHVLRVGFMGGSNLVIETLLGLNYFSSGDNSGNSIEIVPGVNYLVTPMFYVRGEAGLRRGSFDDGTGSVSLTQYAFGGAAGIRKPMGSGALVRVEAGAQRWLENTDDGIPASTIFRLLVGASAVIN